MLITATYSPEDNKIRLSASQRLDKDLYLRVKAAGFIWAPKQGIFVAPKWTPEREDLALELAGEIDDEDTSLVDRAEERADRFEGYSENRLKDAHQAKEAVDRIADGIPLGQPILVGHHSERHARRDAAKIENGMRKAVKMWETSQYWEQRAAGALRHAKYKERPDVRARRIKTLEAELRSCVADYTEHADVPHIMQHGWNAKEGDPVVEHCWVGPKGRGGRWVPVAALERIKAGNARWRQHYENRLIYERAMLGEQGGLKAESFDIQVGGMVQRRGHWFVVTKLNRKGDILQSVSVIGHWCSTIPFEDIKDYRPPADGDAEKVKAIMKAAPLCNFRKEGCKEMTTAEWKSLTHCTESAYTYTYKATAEHGAYRLRTRHCWVKPNENQTCEQPGRQPVFITDMPVKEPPKPEENVKATGDGGYLHRKAKVAAMEDLLDKVPLPDPPQYTPRPAAEPNEFDLMKDSLKAGVKVVSANQLFPTPNDLAARAVEEAAIEDGDRVLEPSAGTGNILRAIQAAEAAESSVFQIVACEIDPRLASNLREIFDGVDVIRLDFLEMADDDGFDVIVMNPPFENGADIKHIEHAKGMLKPGGRLVAICANGPRQNDKLRAWAASWEELEAGTFAGTGVRAVLMTYTEPAAPVMRRPLAEAIQQGLF